MKQWGRWLLCAVLCLGCRSKAPQGARPLEVVVPTEVTSLDPRFTTQSLDIKLTRMIHAGLVGLQPETLQPIPYLAESWRFDGPRALELTLRKGVRFHSGRELRGEDVCATLKALGDPKLGSPHRAVADAIARCTVAGEHTLRIELGRDHATLLTDLEVPVLRADQAYAERGADLDGLGPYRVAAQSEEEVLLEPADNGVLPQPKHALSVRTIHDANVRVLRLMAGRSDIAPNAIPLALLPAVAREPDVTVTSSKGANTTYLLLHNERAPFDDAEVRRGVSAAIDRELIVRTLLSGQARPAAGLMPTGHWAASPGATALPFDPEVARAAFAGVSEITLLTSTDRAKLTVARAVGQMIGDQGPKVRVVPLDLGSLFARLDRGDYQMALLQFPELTEPNVLRWFFHQGNVPGEGPGKNRARYRSAQVSEWLDAAERNPEREQRATLYDRIARQMLVDMPVVPLWHDDQVAVLSPRARGFALSAEGRWLSAASLP